MAVNYREGQMVHQGDVLAEIDPRPFQVQLTQAEGQYQRDVALLETRGSTSIDTRSCMRGMRFRNRRSIPRWPSSTRTGRPQERPRPDRQRELQLVTSRITRPLGPRRLRLVDPGNIVHATDTGAC